MRASVTLPALPPEIFKAYDIRGIVGRTLTPEIVRAVAQSLGTLALERGRDTVVIGRDGRLSGPSLAAALAAGIRSAGTNVIDIGMVTTPMTYFAAHHLGTQCSVMVTGSHNPPDYNGLKMVIGGDALSWRRDRSAEDAHRIRKRAQRRRRLPHARHRAGLFRPHRRRHPARAADARSASTAAMASRARLRRSSTGDWAATVDRAVLRRSTAAFRTTIPIRRSPENLADLIAPSGAESASSVSPSMATATDWVSSPATDT